ncbi:MAG: GlxA family transcriptional regulator [Alphaproteobacteria bacterium]|nr:GlxA family transcriptional regulator [Alphaproteobacteria bacterium]
MDFFNRPVDDRPVRVAFLLVPNFSLMSMACAMEPLRAANDILGAQAYRWTIMSPDGGAISASNGITLVPDLGMAPDGFDIAFVIGGVGVEQMADDSILNWLRRIVRMGTPVVGVSTASYLFARAGLLENRRSTIHWDYLDGFQERFPNLEVDRNLFVIDGPVATCAGGSAAMDMMLHFFGARHGHAVAAQITDWFVLKRMRDPEEAQRMDLRARVGVSHPKLLASIAMMEENLETPLDREQIAHEVNLSTRQLERLFSKHLNTTPRKYYFSLRMHKAQALLRQTSMPILDVGLACGFVSASHFAKCYREFFRRTPREDRGPAVGIT